MKKMTFVSAALILTLSSVIWAKEAKLVSVSTGGGLPKKVDYRVKPMNYKEGIVLAFYVTGENFVTVDEESLRVNGVWKLGERDARIVEKDKDAPKDKSWKLGSFPRVGEDGTEASFSIEKKGDFLGKEGDVKVDGSVIILTGAEVKTVTKKMNVGEDKVDLGPFKVNAGKSKGMFGGEGVHLKGEINTVKNVVVKQDGKELKRQGSSWSGNSKTFNFPEIKGEVEVTVEYWPELKPLEVTFSK